MTPLSILLILISSLLSSSWNFLTKRKNWPVEFFFWVFLWGVLLYLPFFIAFGVLPSFLLKILFKPWWIVILSGFFQTIFVICLIEAYQEGDLSLVYPIARSAPLFTQIWAILFIGEIISVKGVLGIVLVMVGVFLISLKDFHIKNKILQSKRFAPVPTS